VLYAITAHFRPGAEPTRQAIHEQYNEHLQQRHPHVRLAGPLRDEEGNRIGVLILLDADDRAQAERFTQASPYTRADLYERVEIASLDIEVGSLG